MSEELKPCPFCGGNPVLIQNAPGYYAVGCLGRDCRMSLRTCYCYTVEEATKIWNKRVEAQGEKNE